MKNKTILIITGIATGFLFLVALILTITNVLEKWTLFWIIFGVDLATWITVGIVLMIKAFSTVELKSKKISNKEAIKKYIEEVKEEDENPDNLIKGKSYVLKLGAIGNEKTPILVAEFHGTEKNNQRVLVQNLNDPEVKSDLTDPQPEEILEKMNLSPDVPQDVVMRTIKEKFEFGQPIRETQEPIQSQREKEDKKNIEEKSSV